jgi:hypothetical protein
MTMSLSTVHDRRHEAVLVFYVDSTRGRILLLLFLDFSSEELGATAGNMDHEH